MHNSVRLSSGRMLCPFNVFGDRDLGFHDFSKILLEPKNSACLVRQIPNGVGCRTLSDRLNYRFIPCFEANSAQLMSHRFFGSHFEVNPDNVLEG